MLNNEVQKLQLEVRNFAETKLRPIAKEVDDEDQISWDVVHLLSENGLFKYVVPVDYGGYGIKCENLCIIREELSRVCLHADQTFAMSGLGSYPITRFGTDDQKKMYLPEIALGAKIGSFSLTEPRHGSDVANIETAALQKGNYFVINGKKSFASNAAGAEVCTVFVRTGPGEGSKGLSAFIINVKHGGSGLTCTSMKLMSPHPISELTFENYQVPADALLGNLGQGMHIALTNLNMWRVTVGAAATGMAQAGFEEALNYTRKREAFNQKLGEFQAIQLQLAEMATDIEAARALVMETARKRDAATNERDVIKNASMAKLFATEAAQRVVDQALQIHGGWGLVLDARVQLLYRAVRAPRVYEGSSEMQKLTIARILQQ